MRGRGGQMRQGGDDGQSVPGCGQSRAFQCLGAVNWRFDALPPMRCTICRCRTRSKGRCWFSNHPESGECQHISHMERVDSWHDLPTASSLDAFGRRSVL
jgi:hypothetical protein